MSGEGCGRKGHQVVAEEEEEGVCSRKEPGRGEWLLVLFFGGEVEKLFALEVIFWQGFMCTFLSTDLRRCLIKSVVCQERADCGEEGERVCVCVCICQDNAAVLTVPGLGLSGPLYF